MTEGRFIDPKRYAAVLHALAVVRGQLGAVVDGEHDLREVRRVLDATTQARLAAICGMSESEFAVDWNDHLSQKELGGMLGVVAKRPNRRSQRTRGRSARR